MRTLNRREFVRRASVVLQALCGLFYGSQAPAGVPKRNHRQEGSGSAKVVVIGAGLAGLTAALELRKRGCEVIVLEARSLSGGRVRTLREPFSDDLYAEAGATRIPDNHDLTLSYCRQLDLPLIPFRVSGLATVYHIGGKRIIRKRGSRIDWPISLRADEQDLDIPGLRDKYISPVLRHIKGAEKDLHWPPESLKEYDQMTWPEFLFRQGASQGAVLLLTLGHNRGVVDYVSALSWLRYSALSKARSNSFKIEGGNDRLPQALAQRVGSSVQYQSVVSKIEEADNKVKITYLRKGVQGEIDADYVVCAIPFSVLRTVQLAIPISERKRNAIERIGHVSCIRIYFQTTRRFWLDEQTSGFGLTDLPISELWDSSVAEKSERGILQSYVTGEYAKHFHAVNEEERVHRALEQTTRLYPKVRSNFEKGISFCWDDEKWTRGAWAYFKPNEVTSLSPHMYSIEGRVHFAGDQTSPWPGWMQGAIHSGKRVAKEVLGSI